ncbi:MAG: valine--tRNA ligase [Verrucomicrobiota bacterium]|nr:valine--tRNA ligase [Verrucomicrobiota bacterium]
MSEISKAYEPQSVEEKWYQFWLDQKCFVAHPQSPKPAYSIVIPPPNVTGVLTLGHVLNNTIQDILARKARMDGKEVLWLPGTDHAGIATQTVVEKALKKAGEIKHRDDLGRKKFLERVWQWKEKHGGIIIQQLKKLGASCDWTRERFTMDPEYSRCVQKVFVELYKKGLIYRGKRMVNWCPASLTALSDEEVVMKEQKGSLYYFKVEVVDMGSATVPVADSGVSPESSSRAGDPIGATPIGAGETPPLRGEKIFLTIATTRPETIPGDTALAVNPKDPRYAKFIGKHAIRPLPAELPREQKLIPVIGDEHVDFEFGTGVLKVTPAHDKADFEIGQRHNLPQIDIMHPNGHMNQLAGKDLNGLDRFKARKVALEKLAELGVFEKEEPYTNNVGFSERADVPIEPRLSEQWFLKYPSVEKARNCVDWGSATVPVANSGVAPESSPDKFKVAEQALDATPNAARETRALPDKMRFHPQRWAKVYDHWMGGLQDWCISRQLWWGHRIPVWKKMFGGGIPNSNPLSAIEQKAQFDSVEKLQIVKGMKEIRSTETSSASMFGQTFFKFEKSIFENEHLNLPTTTTTVVTALTYDAHGAHALNDAGFVQDPDVLDTWFSSWLWPFATMGWPEQTETLKKFYPTTDLVTGPDIIFFWVARMIMAGYEFMGEMPFRNVYFTGIIRDKQGRKMSKSLGNSPDPLDLVGKYGADALRFGTMRSAPLGQDILFDEQNVEFGRNFCNKLWNACRFRQLQGGEVQGEIVPQLLTSDDKWILLKLDAAIREINAAFAEYKFSDATATLHRFFWSEYCDWYVEASKAALGNARVPRADSGVAPESSSDNHNLEERASGATPDATTGTVALPEKFDVRTANTLAVIDFVLSHTLRLFHPFLPFITEELWHGMGYADNMPDDQGGRTIMFAPWPKPLDDDFKAHYGLSEQDEEFIEARNALIALGRNLRRNANIPANKKVKFIFKPKGRASASDLGVLKSLLNAETVEVNPHFQPAKNVLAARHKLGELLLPLEGLIDVEAETARLEKELDKIEAEIAKVEQKLANPNFTRKVPPNVLAEHRQRLLDWLGKLAHVKSALAALQN